MALHGGGHLELKKMHKGDFWGIFGIRLGRCPCIISEKISFLQFYSRFNPNALALGYLSESMANKMVVVEKFTRVHLKSSSKIISKYKGDLTKNFEQAYSSFERLSIWPVGV